MAAGWVSLTLQLVIDVHSLEMDQADDSKEHRGLPLPLGDDRVTEPQEVRDHKKHEKEVGETHEEEHVHGEGEQVKLTRKKEFFFLSFCFLFCLFVSGL